MALIELTEKLWPHKAAATAFTETPDTHQSRLCLAREQAAISANVPSRAFSER